MYYFISYVILFFHFNRRQEKLKGRESKKNLDYGEESDEDEDEDETTDGDDDEQEEFQELEEEKEEQGEQEKAAREQGKENEKNSSNKVLQSESTPKPIKKTPIVKSKSVVSSD